MLLKLGQLFTPHIRLYFWSFEERESEWYKIPVLPSTSGNVSGNLFSRPTGSPERKALAFPARSPYLMGPSGPSGMMAEVCPSTKPGIQPSAAGPCSVAARNTRNMFC